MAVDSNGNQFVDYVWGNFAPQPDTGRNTPLDGAKGFHAALKAAYNGFPNYSPSFPYLDTIPNRTVPNVVGLTESAANTALTGLGLVKGTVTTADNEGGATSSNDGKIKSQNPAAGVITNSGVAVALVKYVYTEPPTEG